GRVVPGLILRIALRAASLEVDRKGKQAMLPPLGHGLDEFICISLWVPRFRIRVCPQTAGALVQVVEDTLHHTSVEEQSLDWYAVPRASLICRASVDIELLSLDRYLRV